MTSTRFLRGVDVAVWILLLIGGLNWGLIGFFDFNLIAALFGPMTAMTRFIYGLVGVSAVYDALQLNAMKRRWGCTLPHAGGMTAESALR